MGKGLCLHGISEQQMKRFDEVTVHGFQDEITIDGKKTIVWKHYNRSRARIITSAMRNKEFVEICLEDGTTTWMSTKFLYAE
jgi:hypothetical protein